MIIACVVPARFRVAGQRGSAALPPGRPQGLGVPLITPATRAVGDHGMTVIKCTCKCSCVYYVH
jgi:hypothetical protein